MPLLDCPRCLADKSYQAILKFQRQFIAAILKGDSLITLTKPTDQVRWHLVLYQYAQAWCGQEVSPNWKNKKRLEYPKIDTTLTPLCESCRRVFEELAEDQPAEVA